VIVGRALYIGSLALEEAIWVTKSKPWNSGIME